MQTARHGRKRSYRHPKHSYYNLPQDPAPHIILPKLTKPILHNLLNKMHCTYHDKGAHMSSQVSRVLRIRAHAYGSCAVLTPYLPTPSLHFHIPISGKPSTFDDCIYAFIFHSHVYVRSSINFDKRISDHISAARELQQHRVIKNYDSNNPIIRSIVTHGLRPFHILPFQSLPNISSVPLNDLFRKLHVFEKFWIVRFKSLHPFGSNISFKTKSRF